MQHGGRLECKTHVQDVYKPEIKRYKSNTNLNILTQNKRCNKQIQTPNKYGGRCNKTKSGTHVPDVITTTWVILLCYKSIWTENVSATASETIRLKTWDGFWKQSHDPVRWISLLKHTKGRKYKTWHSVVVTIQSKTEGYRQLPNALKRKQRDVLRDVTNSNGEASHIRDRREKKRPLSLPTTFSLFLLLSYRHTWRISRKYIKIPVIAPQQATPFVRTTATVAVSTVMVGQTTTQHSIRTLCTEFNFRNNQTRKISFASHVSLFPHSASSPPAL